jgi:hypothetical protein
MAKHAIRQNCISNIGECHQINLQDLQGCTACKVSKGVIVGLITSYETFIHERLQKASLHKEKLRTTKMKLSTLITITIEK